MNLYENIKCNLKNLNESEKRELEKKENLTEGTKQKRISRYGEVDNGYVLHNYEEMSDEEAEQKAKESSEKDKWDIYYVAYDDVMNPGSNLRWYRGKSYTPEEAHTQLIKDKKENAKKFRDFVDNQLRSGAIDDPEHVNSLSDKEYEDLLVNTWMQDKDMIKAFKDMNESESHYYNKDSEDFEELVKRDFKLYLDDTYGDEEYKNVTEEDINNYFTGLFYDIFDNNDDETAKVAKDIIRKEYGLQDNINESEKDVKDQIKFVCKIDNIPSDEDFINFVYNKHLDGFSGEIMKKLKAEYDKSKTKNESEELEFNNYKDFYHINDVWKYLEASTSEEDLKDRILEIDPKKFGSIYYDLHKDNKGALVTIDYQSDNEDYYEQVDVYFDKDDSQNIDESEDSELTLDDIVKFMYENYPDASYIGDGIDVPTGSYGAKFDNFPDEAIDALVEKFGNKVSVKTGASQYAPELSNTYVFINEAEETQTKTSEPIMVYMNTLKNFNEYGADLETYGIKDGWMTPKQALEFCKKYAKDEPFINDIDNNSGINIEASKYDSEYNNVPSVLEGLVKLNEVLTFGITNSQNDVDKKDIPLVYEAWSNKELASTPSLENMKEFIDFLENGEYYVHNDITSKYDIGKYWVDNVGFEGVSNIENYIDTEQVKKDFQEEIDNDYLDDDGNPTEDWYEVDDSIVEDDIESAKHNNDENFFSKYFNYELLGDNIYNDGYWYLTDNGSVEIY